ncbi:hypothetical protein GCM10010520_56980 [Rhizobium viscosum]|uniref:Uncharacterized protein n=1 Tax=Rhizobium viscosum TaxID=1673 RepID=A0ABR9IVU1_RHIVS|nr:hypothetical protein [Rhizobium viscosum]
MLLFGKRVLALSYPGGAVQTATGVLSEAVAPRLLSLTRMSEVAIARSQLSKINDPVAHPILA